MHHKTSPPTATPDPRRLQAALCYALGQRGLEGTVEYGLSDYIVHAELPDGSSLIISPPQEPPSEHPETPESWIVTRHRSAEPAVYEVIYDSEPDGPHARHGGSVPDLLFAVDARLDQLGVPTRQGQERSGEARAATVLPPDSAPRVALASSPSVGQRVLPTGPPPESSARTATPPASSSSAPRL
ncbi:hypothetical protein OH540_07435 [Streptomyces sp. BPPL-273]|uniref:hypothetical protein n=1 Tax=Streptomyces TaxID=1883 RepID=UPI0024AEDF50|nr:hypothetical protein [Streptomyces sp. BPPL-273]WHM29867.1 hypothetical protein OH540_07435 [Streptomyces sp. BPPL-273]